MRASDLIDREREGTWEKAGEVGTDTGGFLIGDPCEAVRLITGAEEGQAAWAAFCERWLAADKLPAGGGSVAVFGTRGTVVSGFGGDGAFPLYVLRTPQGFVKAALVVFDAAEFAAETAQSEESDDRDG